jgi:flagellin-specific chaperone FliS
MPQANVYGQYRQVQINTASPGKLILLLYQGAIKALKK